MSIQVHTNMMTYAVSGNFFSMWSWYVIVMHKFIIFSRVQTFDGRLFNNFIHLTQLHRVSVAMTIAMLLTICSVRACCGLIELFPLPPLERSLIAICCSDFTRSLFGWEDALLEIGSIWIKEWNKIRCSINSIVSILCTWHNMVTIARSHH